MGNWYRLDLFGPPQITPDWRAASLEDAHEEALEENRRIVTYDGEIPACYHGVHLLGLVPGGLHLSYCRADTEVHETVIVRPRSAAVWRDVLSAVVDEIDPAFTLGELIILLDLPDDVDREVSHRTLRGHDRKFRLWVDALRRTDLPTKTGEATDVEGIGVSPVADLWQERYTFSWNAVGVGHQYDGPNPFTNRDDGAREHWSLCGFTPSDLANVPIRYNPELVFPVSHDEYMCYSRGPLHDWIANGGGGPRPQPPVAFRTQRTIMLGELIGAVFEELGVEGRVYTV
jgi:hypothetical protein